MRGLVPVPVYLFVCVCVCVKLTYCSQFLAFPVITEHKTHWKWIKITLFQVIKLVLETYQLPQQGSANLFHIFAHTPDTHTHTYRHAHANTDTHAVQAQLAKESENRPSKCNSKQNQQQQQV